MRLISDHVLSILKTSAKRTLEKNKHSLLTKTIPVDARVALELGMKVEDKVLKSLDEVPPSVQVLAIVRLATYLEALEAYSNDGEPVAEPVKAPETPQGSKPNDNDTDDGSPEPKPDLDRDARDANAEGIGGTEDPGY